MFHFIDAVSEKESNISSTAVYYRLIFRETPLFRVIGSCIKHSTVHLYWIAVVVCLDKACSQRNRQCLCAHIVRRLMGQTLLEVLTEGLYPRRQPAGWLLDVQPSQVNILSFLSFYASWFLNRGKDERQSVFVLSSIFLLPCN